ncbi:MAG: hypothetical protein VX899_26205 [Myxococcota bacterium]|nr:hypothetical protein [Myxococcota bacterium]
MWLALIPSLLAAPELGVSFTPTAGLASQAGDTGLGEFDGLLRPTLTPWVSLQGEGLWRWQLGLGGARSVVTRWDAGAWQRQAITTLRPTIEAQRPIGEQDGILPFLGVGIWGVVPIVRYTSTAYGPAEQQDARENARGTMARLGGAGISLGGGIDIPVTDQLTVGAAARWRLWRGLDVDEDALSTSALGWGEVSLRVGVAL